MKRLRRCLLSLSMLGPLALILARAGSQAPAVSSVAGATRGPSAILFSRDGSLAYVAEQDEGDVAVLDCSTGKTLAHISTGGKEPTGLALSGDSKTLVAANSFSGSVAIIDTEKRSSRAKVDLPGCPWDVVFGSDGMAYVSVSQLDEIAVIDTAAAKLVARIPTGTALKPPNLWKISDVGSGRRPRALAVTSDGRKVVSANMTGGGLSVIDVAARKERMCVPLPAVNLRGLALSPDGRHAYVTGQSPDPTFSTARTDQMWHNVVCTARIDREWRQGEGSIMLDRPSKGAADPAGIAVDRKGRLNVAAAGVDELLVLTPPGALGEVDTAGVAEEVTASAGLIGRTSVGIDPTAAAARPGTDEVWVANHLDNSISVVKDGVVERLIALDRPSRTDRRLVGRQMFSSARLTPARNFTCNTCHPDGNTDGLSWRFAFLNDGLERRNSRNLRGGILLTGPFGWTQRHEDFEEFVGDEIVHLLQSRKLAHSELHALWDLVNEFDMPPNPYKNADGSLTEKALRGQILFKGEAGCAACHSGARYGATGKKEWVGTTDRSVGLDVPHLIGVYDSAPYLHDGRAATLDEIFTSCNTSRAHGKADRLTAAQLSDLIEFVREL